MNEANIGSHLFNYAKDHQLTQVPYNLVMPLTRSGNIVAILTKPVFHNESNSADLQKFTTTTVANLGEKPSPQSDQQSSSQPGEVSSMQPWATAFGSGLSITLSQLTNSIHNAQQALHDANVLHIDSSSRNFLMLPPQHDNAGNIINVSVCIADYGISGIMSESKV